MGSNGTWVSKDVSTHDSVAYSWTVYKWLSISCEPNQLLQLTAVEKESSHFKMFCEMH